MINPAADRLQPNGRIAAVMQGQWFWGMRAV